MKNLGRTQRHAGKPGAVERAALALARRGAGKSIAQHEMVRQAVIAEGKPVARVAFVGHAGTRIEEWGPNGRPVIDAEVNQRELAPTPPKSRGRDRT